MEVAHTLLDTTDSVIDLLGGNAPTGLIVGASPKAVSNWRESARGKFPPETFVAINHALHALGRKAAPSLWGMLAPYTGRPVEPDQPGQRGAA